MAQYVSRCPLANSRGRPSGYSRALTIASSTTARPSSRAHWEAAPTILNPDAFDDAVCWYDALHHQPVADAEERALAYMSWMQQRFRTAGR